MEWNCRLAAARDLDISFPYLDENLVQFLMSIPGDVQSHDGEARGLMRAAMRGVVPEAIVRRRDKGEFTTLANQSVMEDFDAIRDLLNAEALAVQHGVLDADTLRTSLERWRGEIAAADTAALANRIVDLCGLELFLRAFLTPAGEPAAASTVDPVSC
jgi:asparagine synthetase B (glutamine-hydrolysing)